MEIWKKIKIECLKNYEVSSLGNIRHIKYKKNVKFTKQKSGHLQFKYKTKAFCKNFKVHRIVLSTFTEDFPNLVVNHINNIAWDNRLENLEWLTQGENTRHYYDNFHNQKDNKSEKRYTRKRLKELYETKTWNNIDDFLNSLT